MSFEFKTQMKSIKTGSLELPVINLELVLQFWFEYQGCSERCERILAWDVQNVVKEFGVKSRADWESANGFVTETISATSYKYFLAGFPSFHSLYMLQFRLESMFQ